MPKRLVILCSGNGSNLQAIIDAIDMQKINATIKVVITNKACFANVRAQKHNISSHVLVSKNFASRDKFDAKLESTIDIYNPDFIILAGFMRILTAKFVQHYKDKLINIHPALLPKHKGLHTHKRALEAEDKKHGSSVHNVTKGVDDGAVIAQSEFDICGTKTIEELEINIKLLEHKLYPEVISLLCSNLITIKNNNIYFKGQKLTDPLLI